LGIWLFWAGALGFAAYFLREDFVGQLVSPARLFNFWFEAAVPGTKRQSNPIGALLILKSP
jgi:hypothetical protein